MFIFLHSKVIADNIFNFSLYLTKNIHHYHRKVRDAVEYWEISSTLYHQCNFSKRLIEFLALLTAQLLYVFLWQLSVTNEHMHRQAVAVFKDTMTKISSDPINSSNIGNCDSLGNKLKVSVTLCCQKKGTIPRWHRPCSVCIS